MHKTFFFAVLLAGVLAVSVPAALAEPLSSEHGKDFDRTLDKINPDGSAQYTWTSKPERVFDGSNWVDRIIQNNGTHFNVYSNQGSFSFNKQDCTITQYVKGFDPTTNQAHDSDITIKNWFWTIARKNGANPWQVLDASIFQCSISTSSNSTGKYLNMQRNDLSSGSYLNVKLAAPNDSPIEDYATLYMNKTTWSGNKFAFVLWAKDVKVDSLTFRNGTNIPIPNGVTTYDKSQLTVSSMDFIKNGNSFFMDWKKAQSQFKTLLINKTGTVTDVQFGFNDNAPALTTGQKMTIDPTYGYTSSGVTNPRYYYDGTTGTNCQNSVSGTATTDTTENMRASMTATGSTNGCVLTIPRWSISSISPGSVATSATLRYDVASAVINMATQTCAIFQVTHDPSTNTPTTMYYDGANINNGTTYARGSTTCQTSALDKTIALSSNATDYITNTSIGLGWFALSISQEQARDASIHVAETLSGAGTMDLQIVYTAPRYLNLKPMMADNSTVIGGGYVLQRNSTGTQSVFTVTNSTGWAQIEVPNGAPYNYTVKNSLDNFVVNKTFNKKVSSYIYKQGPTNIYQISCGVGNDFQELMNFTQYHNSSTITAPSCAANDDVSYVIRFIKQGFGPATNATTKLIHRVLDTATYGYSPSKVLVNGSSKSFTFTNNVLNATGIQVGSGYSSVRLSVLIVTDNVTSAPQSLTGYKPNATTNVLSWTAPASMHGDITNGYKIWRNGAILVSNTTTTTTTYTDIAATAGRGYQYMICSLNRIGCSPWSSPFYLAPPDKVGTLIATATAYNEVDLSWSAPNLNGGTLSGYQINYTTPEGTPQTIIVNNTGSALTAYTVSPLSEQTDYSFRVSAWTYWNNATGNIANVTTPARFIVANFTIGSFNFDSENPDQVGIYFSRTQHNSTTTWVNVTYPNTYTLACDITYTYAMTNHTYHNVVHTALNAEQYMATFQFNNATNDIASIYCWNEGAGHSDNGTYVLTQSDFLLQQQVRQFRDGTYGTHGVIGVLDLITIIVVIFSMIGFNRINESVGLFFCLSAIGACAYFGLIGWPGAMFAAIAAVSVFIVGKTRAE